MKLTRKKGGSVQHSQSPIMAKVRAVMTLNYRPQQLLQSRRPLNFKFGLMDSGALSRVVRFERIWNPRPAWA